MQIARRPNDAGDAVLVDAEKVVRCARGRHRVDRDLQTAVRRVLEPNRHGQAARHLAMGLRLRRARADGGPTHEVGDILRDNRVEEFSRRRQTHFGDPQE